MPRTASPEQCLAEATTALRQTLSGLQMSLGEDHPVPGCLPLPTLRLPTDAVDMNCHAQEIDANLWSPSNNRLMADGWVRAEDACPHLPAGGVQVVREILASWRSLLLRADDHAHGRPNPISLADCQATVLARLTDLDRLMAHSALRPPS
ncbi:hypothetical protein QEZ54_08535 [Catellatospora sp. KI3]|uniref:hypothetical protein n=1 Tax=Catellatospora sp. KI3 TaxID=3041620 RepID=UPI00248219D5|nr:hypothetical protein [Catellatospora sp. KI3]MDI1461008.1 hypothetical protein [Catellatospora sp. KI3]